MLYRSTNGKADKAGFLDAVAHGLAPDGGLYVPERYPRLSQEFLDNLQGRDLNTIAFEVLRPYVEGDLPDEEIREVISDAFTFDAPLVQLSDGIFVLELFHGPTLAFKDFGARFMARLMRRKSRGETTILTATSGDTGAAVASAFHRLPGFRVVVLYPSGKVTRFQEQQIATLGDNVAALEVKGNFDDCQRLVKQAFGDFELRSKVILCSANSINVARLLPQTAYFFRACAQLPAGSSVFCSVPGGNFGNLTAGLIGREMGLPVQGFIAATNANDVVPRFLSGGVYEPGPVVDTLSNAMDIADPSNFARICSLFGDDDRIRANLSGSAWSDSQTKQAMRDLFEKYRYIAEPHGAVARLALGNLPGIFVETAHPAKFASIVSDALGIHYSPPAEFDELIKRKKVSIEIGVEYEDVKREILR